MTRLLFLALSLVVAWSPADAAARRPRKKRVAAETAAPAPAAPQPEAPAVVPTAPEPATPAPQPAPEPLYTPEELSYDWTPEQIDSLTAEWHERLTLESFDRYFDEYIRPDTLRTASASCTDSLYAERLRRLVSPVQLPYNPIVKEYIERYTNPRHSTIGRILSLSQYYFPLIEEELLRAGLPVELRAMAIIESALSPSAVSRMGAAGMWQFMPRTGKVYGLEINSLIDERRDPVLSTRAACRYLKDLYALYHDWSLAIAAYNCGPGNVNKALARAGSERRNFWAVYDHLPRETRGYVPAFIGATYAYAYHRLHDIECSRPPIPLATDTVRVDRLLHFGQVASTIDVPIETLRQLNPQYKLDIVPATARAYTLVLPQRNVVQFIERLDSIHAKDSLYLKEYIDPANIDKKRQERGGTVYIVKKGDTLGAIARRYRVTTAQLMRWNGIKNAHKLSLGQRIRIEGR